MNKIVLFSIALAFSASLSAQIIPSVKKTDLKKSSIEAISKQDVNLDSQIENALMKDEGLQKNALDFLKTNPDTSKSLTGLLLNNKDSNSSLMKAVLGDKKLAATVIDYVSKNPKLLKQVTSLMVK